MLLPVIIYPSKGDHYPDSQWPTGLLQGQPDKYRMFVVVDKYLLEEGISDCISEQLSEPSIK